ncbi:hypothetical protein AND_006257 [Anopheles darlingi]|uniref:Uncharacterized protein n=1 Tax=Anopheles darlingi TaxID=43151 RepID=W5JGX5_ANODA|nr:hypothetical protein AND_006257 [Anopheles darlingi]
MAEWDYTTPLILAAAGGHTACVIELLEQGADPNARRVTGTTALFFAAQGGYVDVARILLKAGAPVDCSSVVSQSLLCSFFVFSLYSSWCWCPPVIPSSVNHQPGANDGGTPLFVACQGGHEAMVGELLSHGANVHACMKIMYQPSMMRGVTAPSREPIDRFRGKPKEVESAAPGVGVKPNAGSSRSSSSSSAAGAKGHTGSDRATPLFIAAQNGHSLVMKLLLAAGANPDAARNDGATPLWIAAQMGHDHIVKILLHHGAYVDAVRCDGATALFKAAHKGHSSVVHELLKHRPCLGLLENGETALHAAVMFGHLPIVKQLVGAGCDCGVKNQDGYTPLQLARQQQYASVYQYLKERIGQQHTDHQPVQQQQQQQQQQKPQPAGGNGGYKRSSGQNSSSQPKTTTTKQSHRQRPSSGALPTERTMREALVSADYVTFGSFHHRSSSPSASSSVEGRPRRGQVVEDDP